MNDRLLQRWHEIEPLLEQAMDLPPDRQEAFIEGHCAGDEELTTLLRGLLTADRDASDFLEQPLSDKAATLLASLAEGGREEEQQRSGPSGFDASILRHGVCGHESACAVRKNRTPRGA